MPGRRGSVLSFLKIQFLYSMHGNAAFYSVFCWLILPFLLIHVRTAFESLQDHDCFITTTIEFYLVQTWKIRNVFSGVWKHKTKLSLW